MLRSLLVTLVCSAAAIAQTAGPTYELPNANGRSTSIITWVTHADGSESVVRTSFPTWWRTWEGPSGPRLDLLEQVHEQHARSVIQALRSDG